MTRDINPNVKLLKEAADRNEDPKDVVLMENCRGKGSGKGTAASSFSKHVTRFHSVFQASWSLGRILIFAIEVARCFGESCTKKAIEHRLANQIKPNVKLILQALQEGHNPEEIPLIGVPIGAGNGQT